MISLPAISRRQHDRFTRRFFNHGTLRHWHFGINTKWTGHVALIWTGRIAPWRDRTRDTEMAIEIVDASVDLFITYVFRHGTNDTYDASRGGPGGWDPGDPPKVDVHEVEVITGPKEARHYERAPRWLIDIVANSDVVFQHICGLHDGPDEPDYYGD